MASAKRIDKGNHIIRALRQCGFDLTSIQMEVILNIAELVKEKGDSVTMKQIAVTEQLAIELFEDSPEQAVYK